jgi:hypothetical protein
MTRATTRTAATLHTLPRSSNSRDIKIPTSNSSSMDTESISSRVTGLNSPHMDSNTASLEPPEARLKVTVA